MPAEHRVIRFGPNEIYKALKIKSLEDDLPPLPEGHMVSLSVDKDKDANVIFVNTKNDGGKDQTIKFTRDFFGQALIFYCRGHNIPLPHGGVKTIQVMEKEIAMEIKMGETN